MSAFSLGIILNTHNKPRHLDRVLHAFAQNRSLPDEIIIADDGSGPDTQDVIRAWTSQLPFPLRHAWQEHQGYRRSRILNLAIAQATADYLVFVDGDCLPLLTFTGDHRRLARPGAFVQARRAFIDESAVPACLSGETTLPRLILQGKVSGLFKLIRLPLPLVRTSQQLHGILGCNLAVWREDLIAINGYDEAYEGWGAEDSDLAARLYHLGRHRRLVHGRAVLCHLNHPRLPRDRYEDNQAILRQTLASRKVRCTLGLDQHLSTPSPRP